MLRNSLFLFYVWVSNKECAHTFLMCTFQCESPLQYLSFSLSLSLSLYFFIDVVLLHSLVHIPGDVASFRKIFSCCPSSVVIRHTPLGITNNCSWFCAYFQWSKSLHLNLYFLNTRDIKIHLIWNNKNLKWNLNSYTYISCYTHI